MENNFQIQVKKLQRLEQTYTDHEDSVGTACESAGLFESAEGKAASDESADAVDRAVFYAGAA